MYSRPLLVAFSVGLLQVSCTSDTGAPATRSSGTKPTLSSAYSFKFYADDGVSRTLVKVVPREVAQSAYQNSGGIGSAGVKSLDLKLEDTPPTSGSGPEVFVATGPESLIVAAATECGMVNDPTQTILSDPVLSVDPNFQDIVAQENANQSITWQAPTDLWGYAINPANNQAIAAYTIFQNLPRTCDQVLEYTETLVCVADKLAQLADAVAPVTWHAVRFNPVNRGTSQNPVQAPPLSWIIPPPADSEKFIVRDLALEVLAQVPLMDAYAYTPDALAISNPTNANPPTAFTTCSAYYATLNTIGATPTVTKSLSGITVPYPPFDPLHAQFPTLAHQRWAFESNVLRAAGQLAHDILRESVYADLAGSASVVATAADQTQGHLTGLGLDPSHPYNSLAHVARLLFGRWDNESGNPDPQCRAPTRGGTAIVSVGGPPTGVTEMALLPALADQGMVARANDLGTLTKTQTTATTLFEETGLVVADGSSIALDKALTDQLTSVKAHSSDPTVVTAYGQSTAGQALAALVSSLSQSDLARAAAHNRTTFSMLTLASTSNAGNLATAAGHAALTPSSYVNATLAGSGIAISGGLSRALVSADPTARSGPMMIASQCGDTNGAELLQDDTVAAGPDVLLAPHPTAGNGATWAPLNPFFEHQDIFAVANAIRARMVKLREVADKDTMTPDSPLVVQARAAAVAEIGAWAGPGRAIISTDTTGIIGVNHLPQSLYVDLIGLSPADYGLSVQTDFASALELVVGDAKTAECAANVSTTGCNAPSTGTVLAPVASTQDTFGPTAPSASLLRSRYGVTSGFVRLTFTPGATIGDGAGPCSGWDEPIYLVLHQDPNKQAGVGKVLGAMALPIFCTTGIPHTFSTQYASFNLSPMREELVHDAFGLGKWVGQAPPRIGGASLTDTPGFCIDGVPRDLFVPLDNDLTNSTDTYENSWKNYLALAQAAATNADAIGEELVKIGFDKDVQTEGAGVQLMSIDGQSPNVDDITVTQDGTLNVGSSNGALSAILNPATFDVVFFSKDPTGGTPDHPPSAAALQGALNCPANASSGLCRQLQTNAPTIRCVDPANAASLQPPTTKNVVTYTALGLSANVPVQQHSPDQCGSLIKGALSMKGLAVGLNGPTHLPSIGFDPASFNAGISTWGADPTGIQSVLSGLVMTVNADASWEVALNGSVLMDSTSKSGNWPGCLSGSTCAWSNPLIASENSLLRWCSPPLDLQQTPLGGCDNNNEQNEINSLRWRVEGTLWLAAMMTGGVPPGMFVTPIPAVDYSGGSIIPADIGTFYSSGEFTNSQGVVQFAGKAEASAADALTQAKATFQSRPGPWYQWGTHGNALPPQLANIYILAAPPFDHDIVHVTGANLEGGVDFTSLGKFFDQLPGGSGASSKQLGPSQLVAIANQLAHVACSDPSGDGTIGSATIGSMVGSNWLQGLVAALKTLQSPKSALRSPIGADWTYQEGFTRTTFDFNGVNFGYWDASSTFLNASTSTPWPLLPILSYRAGSSITSTWSPTASLGSTGNFVGTAEVQQAVGITATTVDARVPLYVNAGVPNDNCDAAWQFTQAVALSCALENDVSNNLTGSLTPPDQLTSPAQLNQLAVWLNAKLGTATGVLQNAFVQGVPASIVASAIGAPGSLVGNGGAVATHLSGGAKALVDVYRQWNTVLTGASKVSDAIKQTNDAIEQIVIQGDIADANAEIAQLQSVKAIAEDVAQIVSGISNANNPTQGATSTGLSSAAGYAQAIAGGIGVASDTASLVLEKNIENLNNGLVAQQLQQALTGLHDTATAVATDMSNALSSMRQDADDVTAASEAFATDGAEASYYAGKASGVDVWNCTSAAGTVQECVSHVNTVLNRRYAGYQIRYAQALNQAKALGYMARRAIEQRIGIRLNDITSPIGPLDPPQAWADKVCSLQGINFAALNSEVPDAGSTAQQAQIDTTLAQQYADGFIGDWVQKLSEFVSYYNVAYPEQDGNDVAVLSLRETLLGSGAKCVGPSPNLLLGSSELYNVHDGSSSSVGGWTRDWCPTSDGTCIQARWSPNSVTPPGAGPGKVTWLSDQPRPASASGFDPVNDGALPASPDGYVSQAVSLTAPGAYVLSWWDQASDMGGLPTQTTVNDAGVTAEYQVAVYDSAWNEVARFSGAPTPTDGTLWSARHALTFMVPTSDIYHVAFGASGAVGSPSSVLIGDPQLELAGVSGAPTAYVDTGDDGTATTYACAPSSADLRGAFQHVCDPDGICHYDARVPIVVNTQTMTSNGQSLAGKLAIGNYNFRHVNVAVNVVGTGVINCTQTSSPDCFGSAYLSYSLTHDASNVGVLGYDGAYRQFDFGTALVSHAKALTAERYLTLPLSSSDQQLVSQFQQIQLAGRPVDGAYTLQIFDSPALDWSKVQDIQFVLNYHYWSKVTLSSGG